MPDLDILGASLDPQQFALLVKSTPDGQLGEVMAGDDRAKILDGMFARMPELFRPDRAGSTSAVVHWTITGAPGGGADTYELVIANGTCEVTPRTDALREPRLAITVGPVDFLKVISGNGNPMMMFMTGKLKAKGDLGLAASISQFFETPKG
jgi:putative sterol carrier protein